MRCVRCGHLEDKVIDSRQSKEGDSIRRRRECLECGFRFTTYERIERTYPLVVKRDGRREDYVRDKILAGLQRACEKRPVSIDALEDVVDRIESELTAGYEREISSKRVGDLVMRELRGLDGVAYLRFASVYQSFEDISQFLAEAAKVTREKP